MSFSVFNISDIIFKSLKADLTAKEKGILDDWLKVSAANRECYERVLQKANFVSRKQLYKELEVLKDYDYINQHIQRETKNRYLRYFISSAAAIILCFLGWYFLRQEQTAPIRKPVLVMQKITPGKAIAILETAEGETVKLGEKSSEIVENEKTVATSKGNTLSYAKQVQKPKNQAKEVYNTLKIPRGGEYKLLLSDGTQVWLNSETTIKYPVQFLKKQRVVYVSGEAFFDVAPNKNSPFIIKSGKTVVKVLGTTFNFRAYENEKYLQTTLVSGSVNVSREGKTRVLKPLQQYSYNKKTNVTEVKKVDVSLYTSWKDGLFLFKSQKLEYILGEIARWYNMDFVYEDAILKNYVFSGRLQKYDDATPLLRVFEETGGVTFERKGRKIYVRKNREN